MECSYGFTARDFERSFRGDDGIDDYRLRMRAGHECAVRQVCSIDERFPRDSQSLPQRLVCQRATGECKHHETGVERSQTRCDRYREFGISREAVVEGTMRFDVTQHAAFGCTNLGHQLQLLTERSDYLPGGEAQFAPPERRAVGVSGMRAD